MKAQYWILIVALSVVHISKTCAETITFEFRAADGTTPITQVNIENPDFTLAIIGDWHDGELGQIRLYDCMTDMKMSSHIMEVI
jgi:hypothetical protein